ncbi:hypothetical protein BDP27DRAFT_1183914, partial [Rhodocollybia butyracea]
KKPRESVLWREDIVDNEGAGKESSKTDSFLLICCICHKQKAFDESLDKDNSSAEDSDSSFSSH